MLLDYAPPDFAEDTATPVDSSHHFRPSTMSGRAAVQPSPRRSPGSGQLVLLTDDPTAVEQKPCVRAILPKNAPADLVAAAARLAAAGYTVRKVDESAEASGTDDAKSHFVPESALTHREMQVLSLLADGASNKVIARKLFISVHTAKFHVASVTAKLRARNRTDAISIALREGVLAS